MTSRRRAVVGACALLAAMATPAGAQTIRLPVTSTGDRDRGLVEGRPVEALEAALRLPTGSRVDEETAPPEVEWHVPERCGPAGVAYAVTWDDRRVKVGEHRLRLVVDGVERAIPAALHVRTQRHGRGAALTARLPAGVLPAYPQRLVSVGVFTIRLGRRCPHTSERLLRRAVASTVVRITGDYVAPPPTDRSPIVDLRTLPRLTIGGPRPGERLGGAVLAAVGDVTGDGRTDLAFDEPSGPLHVLGVRGPGRVDLARARTTTLAPVGFLGSALGVGDLDGDGTDDLALASPREPTRAGRVRMLRGGPRLGWKLLSQRRGERCDELGAGAASAGSFLGAGTAALALTTQRACGQIGARLHVVPALGRGPGVTLTGFGAPEPYGLAGLGDANGDGLDDLLVGGELLEDERATIVFGAADQAPVRVDRPGARGILLRAAPCEALGGEVAAAGDVNGDGLADALVSSSMWCRHHGPYAAPGAYVVLGGPPAEIDAGAPGARVLRIGAERVDDVAGVGDQDGDGLADVALVTGRTVHLVRGRREPGALDLRTLGAGGRRIRVPGPPRYGLGDVTTVPDVNGDGRPELAVSSPRARFAGRRHAGAVFVAFSPLL